MIVKNEEASLPTAISSVREVVDEIVVVDTGSKDKTAEVARSLGAKVYVHAWQDDFSLARNESLKQATGRYILWMDADDVIPHDEISKLLRLRKALKTLPKDAFYFRLVNPMEGGEEQVCMHLRIFPNLQGVSFEGAIHEQVIPSLERIGCREVYTDITIHHLGYHSHEAVTQKARRNLQILLRCVEQNPDDFYSMMQLGFTYSTLGQDEKAQRYFKKVMECRNPLIRKKRWHPFAFICSAIFNRNNGNMETAVGILKDLIRDFPDNGYARFLLGEIYYFLGDINSAVPHLYDVTEDRLNSVVAIPIRMVMFKRHFILGECLRKMGNLQEAEMAYQACLKIAPDSLEVMLALKNLYVDMITAK